MPSVSRRGLYASAIVIGLVAATVTVAGANALAGPTATASSNQPSQNVIVLLRDQHTNLALSKGHIGARVTANRKDQTGAIAKARTAGARNLRGFDVVNGYGATVTAAQASQIATNPDVLGVFPDLPIRKGPSAAVPAGLPGKSSAAPSAANAICPSSPSAPILEPEALQVTNTAFSNTATPQAQNTVDGTGVKVGYIADGIDINNPDFIRANGQHVFVDYQDFSGEGPNALSGAAEAFGDASAIAAQGRQVYDLANFVSTAHPLPAGCDIQIRGMAPGASLVGLKVFGNAPTAPTSRFIEAIDYAVDVAGVDVLNESFGGNPFPDNSNDPITLADEAAVAAGVTVVASTGDAGTNGTNGSPSTSDKVISVAASTTFRGYAQDDFSGFNDFSNGTWANNNISSLSSGGVTQSDRVPDLVAPGDQGWALCTPDTDVYEECTDDNGGPSPIQLFGGTSQSSPLTSGAAALVIEAYKNTHHGVRPTPALVARFLTGTATDLGHPAYEQGAGLLNSLAAVQAAESYKDSNGSPAAVGSALIPDKSQNSVIGYPGGAGLTSVTVRNVSGHAQTVHATTRTLGRPVTDVLGTAALNTATAPAYIDAFGISRSYVAKTFTVGHVDRLSVSFAIAAPKLAARVILIDPHGVYTAYSLPQGDGNWGNADVRFPAAGTWTAYFALSTGTGFNGSISYEITTNNYTTHGVVLPSTFTIPAGGTKTVVVATGLPSQPGDLSTSLQLASSAGTTTSIPVTLRSVVPPRDTTFTGKITGGNGRAIGGPAQANSYYIDVPAGKRDFSLGVTFPDPNMVVLGVLTAPDGQVYSFQSNLASDGSTEFGGLQIYRRDPQAGRWVFSFDVTNPVSGLEVSQPFTAKVAYNTVKIHASLPNSTATRLKAGVPVTVPVTITNTGAVPLSYFADARLKTVGTIPLAELSGNSTDIPLPVPAVVTPLWIVPADVSQLTISATADQPVNLDTEYNSGEPEVYSAAQGNGATVKIKAGQVSPGLWFADIGQSGPFSGPATPGSVSVSASAVGRLFDPAVESDTVDFWQVGVDPAAQPALAASIKARGAIAGGITPAKSGNSTKPGTPAVTGPPVDLPPGASTTIMVTITPSGPVGSVVRGDLFIDSINFPTNAADEMIDLPYSYTIGR